MWLGVTGIVDEAAHCRSLIDRNPAQSPGLFEIGTKTSTRLHVQGLFHTRFRSFSAQALAPLVLI